MKENELMGKKVSLKNLADYQENAVVSREVIKKESGTVTVFSFDRGQGLSEHTAPYDALVCVLDGTAEVIISGKSSLVREGEAIMMPANEPHALQANERFKMMLVMIRS